MPGGIIKLPDTKLRDQKPRDKLYNQFLNAQDRDVYWRTMEWLMWQMGGVGPMFGQVHHFSKYNPGKSDSAQERYEKEPRRVRLGCKLVVI